MVPGLDNEVARRAVTYLDPSERSGHDISIKLRIDAGVAIEGLRATHDVVTNEVAEGMRRT